MDNYEAHELTSVFFGEVVPSPPERRAEERQTSLLRVGKLIVGLEQRLCMIRNISSAGAMLRLYQPIDVGTDVEVEVTPDCPVPATVIWVQDDLAGVAFAESIDVVEALRGASRMGPYRRVARTPRLRIRRAATMHTDDLESEVTLCDLSLNGAKFETEAALSTDMEVALFVDGLPPLTGRVRWCHDLHAGMEFDIPVQMDVLAEWMGSGATQPAA
ncbi:PilZ domain-containing protein [Sphingomonas sp. LB-2]|uniref:PilZ domain-containing protein n=1 Tax=Sphingomonas caeni TaxID=2984949 RepID=UPI0022314E23|nr:PilZ domain-containing protein [Sphingomonas caeni]MCW3846313.1 PilZ domain-containing protein [Sphingomonas caeni]